MKTKLKPELERPSPLEFASYRDFFDAYYRYRKMLPSGFSFRMFADEVSLSAAHLKLLIDGKRNLRPTHLKNIAAGLGLSSTEIEHLNNLLIRQTAKAKKSRLSAADGVLQSDKIQQIPRSKFDLFKKWYYVAIRHLIDQADAVAGSWPDYCRTIAERLGNAVTAEQVQEAIETLLQHGFIREEKGKLKVSLPSLTSGNDQESTVLRDFQKQMMRRAIEQVDNVPLDLRECTTVIFNVPRGQVQKLKKRIRECQRELLNIARQANASAKKVSSKAAQLDVYACAVQLMPLTKHEGGN